MCKSCFLFCLMTLGVVAFFGCSRESSPSPESTTEKTAVEIPSDVDPEVTAALGELSAEDRALAVAQKFCAVETGNLLGSMGAPVKVMVEGEPVFLCCAACEESALANPQKTLASVKKLKAANEAAQ